jgi:F-type H+-transporting ATPase subunit epsilon
VASVSCQIVTPEGVVFTGGVQMVIVPGEEGEIGALARHSPIIAKLKVGSVRIKHDDGSFQEWATNAGYFKMQRDQATILVDAAEPAAAIDVEKARADADDARNRIELAEAGDETIDRFRAERDLLYAENRLAIAGR